MDEVNDTVSFREQLTIASSLDMLDEVYRWSGAHISRLPLDDTKRYEITLAISEAVTNAIRHGNGEDPDTFVVIILEAEGNEVAITISDEGRGFDPDSLPDPTKGERLLTPNGRGVFLLRSLADDVHYEFSSNGTTVIARFIG